MAMWQTIIAHEKNGFPRCVLDTQIPRCCWPFILLTDKLNVVWIVFLRNLCPAIVHHDYLKLVLRKGLILVFFKTPKEETNPRKCWYHHRQFYHPYSLSDISSGNRRLKLTLCTIRISGITSPNLTSSNVGCRKTK